MELPTDDMVPSAAFERKKDISQYLKAGTAMSGWQTVCNPGAAFVLYTTVLEAVSVCPILT